MMRTTLSDLIALWIAPGLTMRATACASDAGTRSLEV
jgi:hypothetical protein